MFRYFVNTFVNNRMLTVNYAKLLDKSTVSTQKKGGGGGLTPYPSLKSVDRPFIPAWLSGLSCQQVCVDRSVDRFKKGRLGMAFPEDYEMHKKAPAMIVGFEDNHPIVACYRVGDQLTFLCPFCGCRHWHGGGERFGEGDGHRVAHCAIKRVNNSKGYILKEFYHFKFSGYLPKKWQPNKGNIPRLSWGILNAIDLMNLPFPSSSHE